MTQTLRERLLKYLLKTHGYVSSGDLQRLVAQYTTYSPQNTGRRLRELTEDGLLTVEYRKGHAWYAATDKSRQTPSKKEFIPGTGNLPTYEEVMARNA